MPRLIVNWIRRTLFLYTIVDFVGAIEKTCSPIIQLPVQENSRLTGAVIDTVISSGVVTCAKECLSRHACKSYNFHLDDGTCELNSEDIASIDGAVSATGVKRFVFSVSQNWPQRILGACKDHNCPLNTRCVEVRSNTSLCVITYCTAPPAVKHATASSPVSQVTPVNQSLQLECTAGYVPCGNAVTCKPDGTWTVMTCKRLSNCGDVLQFSPTYTDGEYWLYPQPLNGERVKVYCHGMNNTPSEYISLTTPYFMDAPRISNFNCSGNDTPAEKDWLGHHIYSKFGLDVQTMEIRQSDDDFYSKEGNKSARVGEVRDCYSRNCGPVGRAVIDLRGTGFSLDTGVTWKMLGKWGPNVTRSSNGQLIEIRCGGYCGVCKVNGSLSLSFAESDAPAENSATVPTCA
ncbi:uncharacterized protein LOC124125804 [Haliotis rufescens]|uniref:uncharacterized protein LOC124125804 n=1 Tax=Haliotis rufescens TaxID=6454 RepID=UPI00201EC15C|nr:uncharacterized protein LOC124125804 [Haliotis rufescens]